METPPPTRDRLVETTARLVSTQGYAATGLSQILTESCAPKGSLYFHFPGGKEEMVAEAIRQLGVGVAQLLEAHLQNAATTALGLQALIRTFIAEVERSGYQRGCPVALTSLESSHASERLRNACGLVFQAFE